MRVLGLVHQYLPHRNAGAESHIHTMLRALVQAGHHVDVVLSAQAGQPYDFEGVHVHPTVNPKTDTSPFLVEADLIVTHLANTLRATVLGRFNDIPVCCVHHNDFEQTRDALLLDYSRTDLVVVNSHWMHESLIDWAIGRNFQLPPCTIVRPIAEPATYATKPGDRVTLINLRRLEPTSKDQLTKGGEIFRALAERLPEVDFLGVTGIYGIQQDLADLPNVEVIDHVPHDRMRELVYARTKVLLVPSSYESWGRVASEALCSGIPVIATPTTGLCEQLGEAGIFAPFGDVDAWVAAIRQTLRPRSWAQASKAARARSVELADAGRRDLERWVVAAERTVAQGGFRPRALQEFLA